MIPLGIMWAGYTLVWYGYALLKDWGIGITDLIKPSAGSKIQNAINAQNPPSNTNGNAPNTPQQSAGNHGAIFGVGGPVP